MRGSLLRAVAAATLFFILGSNAEISNSIRDATGTTCKTPLKQLEGIKQVVDDYKQSGTTNDDKEKALKDVDKIEFNTKSYQCQDILKLFREKAKHLIKLQYQIKSQIGSIEETQELSNKYREENRVLVRQISGYKKEADKKRDEISGDIEKNPAQASKIIGLQLSKIEVDLAVEFFLQTIDADTGVIVREAYKYPSSIEYILDFLDQLPTQQSSGIKALFEVVKNKGDASKPQVFLVYYAANKYYQNGVVELDLNEIRSGLQVGITAKMNELSQFVGEKLPNAFLEYDIFYPGFLDLFIDQLIQVMIQDVSKLHTILDFTINLTPTQKARVFVKLLKEADIGKRHDRTSLSFSPRLIHLLGKLWNDANYRGVEVEGVAKDALDIAVDDLKEKYLYAPATTVKYGIPLDRGVSLLTATSQMNADASRVIQMTHPGFPDRGVEYYFQWSLDTTNNGKSFRFKNLNHNYMLTVRNDNKVVAATSPQDGSEWWVLGKPNDFKSSSGRYYLCLLYNVRQDSYLVPSKGDKAPPQLIRGSVDVQNIDNYWRGMVPWEDYP